MQPRSFVLACLSTVLTGLAVGCEADSNNTVKRENLRLTIPGTQVVFEMVWIPEGRFWIGKTEVTWDEYLVYCDFDNPARETGKGVDGISRPSKPLEDVAPFDRDWGLGRRPAVGMSWNAAKRYCEWLSKNLGRKFRLPTESEWLLACGPVPPGTLSESAWFDANSDEMTQDVGRKRPNKHGLHDALGNLWEYCANPFSPKEPDRAVLRGGSWEDPATRLTPQSRLGFEDDWVLEDPNVPPGVWWVPDGNHLGLRILCEID